MIRAVKHSIAATGLLLGMIVLFASAVSASPFGWGVFGADVPFGSATSLSIDLGGNVSVPLSADGVNYKGSSSHTITVTSTDVVGYRLYVYTTGSTNMTSSNGTIPASSNSSPGALAVNSWGYNISGSTTDFMGMLATNTLVKDASGPHTDGDTTTVTYGALAGPTQAAGTYNVGVVYTAVSRNQ